MYFRYLSGERLKFIVWPYGNINILTTCSFGNRLKIENCTEFFIAISLLFLIKCFSVGLPRPKQTREQRAPLKEAGESSSHAFEQAAEDEQKHP